MKRRKVIGTAPGLGKLARAMKNAETEQKALELFFSSRHVPDDEKRRVLVAMNQEAWGRSLLRRVP